MMDVNTKWIIWSLLLTTINASWKPCEDYLANMPCIQPVGNCTKGKNSSWIAQIGCQPPLQLFCCEADNEWYTETTCRGNKIDDTIFQHDLYNVCDHVPKENPSTQSPDDPDNKDGGDIQQTLSATIIIIIIVSSVVAMSVIISSAIIFFRNRRRNQRKLQKINPQTNKNTMSGSVSYSNKMALTSTTSTRDPDDEVADYTYIDTIEDCTGNEYNHIQTPLKPITDNTYSHIRSEGANISSRATPVADDTYSHVNNKADFIKMHSHVNDNTNDYDTTSHKIIPVKENISFDDSVYNHTTDDKLQRNIKK